MRFTALARDYDGTIAPDGKVDNETLGGVRTSSRQRVLVTGRALLPFLTRGP